LQLVGRLSQDELVTQLPSFLPAVFDAFNNLSPDVRKVLTYSSDMSFLEGHGSSSVRNFFKIMKQIGTRFFHVLKQREIRVLRLFTALPEIHVLTVISASGCELNRERE
jgi:hypothetical protein